MTPGQARVALGMFLLVSAGVVVNALLLQSDAVSAGRTVREPTPAGTSVPRGRGVTFVEVAAPRGRGERSSPEEQALRIARFAADPGKIDAAAAPPGQGADAETVHAIQRELKLRGYGPVTVDGALGLATRAAIMAFEHDHGMALSGEASERLLKRILLGTAEPTNGNQSIVDPVASAHATEVIGLVQQRLAALGYRPGATDGRLREETVAAIREFEMDKGLVPRGRVSAELAVRLEEAAPAQPLRR